MVDLLGTDSLVSDIREESESDIRTPDAEPSGYEDDRLPGTGAYRLPQAIWPEVIVIGLVVAASFINALVVLLR